MKYSTGFVSDLVKYPPLGSFSSGERALREALREGLIFILLIFEVTSQDSKLLPLV